MDRITLERIRPLLRKYLEGTISDEESRSLEAWANAATENRALLRRISDPEQLQQDLKLLLQSNENIFSRLQAAIPELSEKKQHRLRSSIAFISCAAGFSDMPPQLY